MGKMEMLVNVCEDVSPYRAVNVMVPIQSVTEHHEPHKTLSLFLVPFQPGNP